MDQTNRDRSPSMGQLHIKQSHSPSPAPPFNPDQPVGLGLGLDNQSSHFAQADFSQHYNNSSNNNSAAFITTEQAQTSFPPTASAGLVPAQELPLQDPSAPPTSASLVPQPQPSYNLSPSFQPTADFSLFPPATTQSEQFTAPLFDPQPNQPDMNDMASPQTHPTPPHMLNPEPHQTSQHSPSFNQHQFAASPGHSRNASLGPEAALLPGQMAWDGPSFQTHRRSPSEYSDVSSVTHSPNMPSQDNFDQISNGHSPMQRAQDGSLYETVPFENFNINDNPAQGSPNPGRSPSHSPAISPRVMPAQIQGPPSAFALAPHSAGFVQPPPFVTQSSEAFPTLPQEGMGDIPQMQMTTPSISFTPAPPGAFDPSKHHMDQDALTPPDRGRTSRRRAHTDPYSSSAVLARPPGGLSPHLGAELRSDSRSLSPLDRQPSPSNRRKSIGSVPNNEMALRLADPEYHGGAEGGAGAKRQQKHPATFSCHLCPKKFTRAYNLRSHLRTHTDERPFVCSVCGKAFARQHDRKRHEGLHSGEKKFVCKGDLKVGGQWGCGRRFARADALGRHFRSEAGRICIKPLLDEEMMERQRAWHEQQQRNMAAQQMAQPHMLGDPNAGYPVDPSGGYALPQALLAQYPALAQMNWSAPDMSGGGSGMEDDLSGRSSFDASDYDEGDDGGYVSGPGTGFGPGGMNEGYGEVGYSSDFGPRS